MGSTLAPFREEGHGGRENRTVCIERAGLRQAEPSGHILFAYQQPLVFPFGIRVHLPPFTVHSGGVASPNDGCVGFWVSGRASRGRGGLLTWSDSRWWDFPPGTHILPPSNMGYAPHCLLCWDQTLGALEFSKADSTEPMAGSAIIRGQPAPGVCISWPWGGSAGPGSQVVHPVGHGLTQGRATGQSRSLTAWVRAPLPPRHLATTLDPTSQSHK